jgi:hypothetical protein
MMWIGHIESAHAPMPSVQFILAQERPNKTRFEIDAMGDKTLRVFDGGQGWKMRPSHGRADVRPYTLEEVRFEQGGPGIDGVLIDYAAKGSTVEVSGVDEIEKRPAYHLTVRNRAGETQHVWVDARTFLEVRYDRPVPAAAGASLTPSAPDPSRTVTVMYRDYKTFEGVQIPSVIETGVRAGNTPDRMVIEKVLLNPHLDARTFIEPGARGNHMRAASQPSAFPLHHPPGGRSLPAWLSPTNPAGPQAPPPSAAWAVPAQGSPPPQPDSPAQPGSPQQPGSSSASGQDRE